MATKALAIKAKELELKREQEASTPVDRGRKDLNVSS